MNDTIAKQLHDIITAAKIQITSDENVCANCIQKNLETLEEDINKLIENKEKDREYDKV